VGNTGSVAYTTGYLDLLGRHDDASVSDPWLALQTLRQTEPQHPLNRVAAADIRRAFAEFTAFLGEAGLHYTAPGDANLCVLTPVGTLKQTLCVPATMAAGSQALAAGESCVIVNIHGLKGFSGAEIVANLRQRWPALGTQRITFPDMAHGEVYPEVMACALQVPATRAKLAQLLKAAAGQAQVIGVPAILGIYRPDDVHAELERLSGLRIF